MSWIASLALYVLGWRLAYEFYGNEKRWLKSVGRDGEIPSAKIAEIISASFWPFWVAKAFFK